MNKKKVAVITGGSFGIGRAVAEKLVEENYAVISADIHPPKEKSPVHHVNCDITKAEDIARLYEQVKGRFGLPNVLISNAGQGIHEKITEGDPEKWARIIDINLMGALRFVRAFVGEMMQQGKGSIFFISSTAANQAYSYGGIYSASKAALNMVAKTLKLETEGKVRVSVISPGVVDSSFFENMVSGHHTVSDIGWGSISSEQVAAILHQALLLPSHINLSEITITPTLQPN